MKMAIVIAMLVITGCSGTSALRDECESVGGKFMKLKPVKYGQNGPAYRTTSCLYSTADGELSSENWKR